MFASPDMNTMGRQRWSLLFAFGVMMTSACSASPAPDEAVVAAVMKQGWDKVGPPKTELTLNSVAFGEPYQATAQEVQVEGIPQGMVTPAIVDFTVRTYYASETQAHRRVREARVYVDKMGDWAVMTGQVKGEDATTIEPAAR